LVETAAASVEVSTTTYNAAVSAYNGRWIQARRPLVKMAAAHVELNIITCNAAVSACKKGGR